MWVELRNLSRWYSYFWWILELPILGLWIRVGDLRKLNNLKMVWGDIKWDPLKDTVVGLERGVGRSMRKPLDYTIIIIIITLCISYHFGIFNLYQAIIIKKFIFLLFIFQFFTFIPFLYLKKSLLFIKILLNLCHLLIKFKFN